MIEVSKFGLPFGGGYARAYEALKAAHDALNECAESASHLLGQVNLGPDGEGQDFAAELEAIRDDARAAAAKIVALEAPE